MGVCATIADKYDIDAFSLRVLAVFLLVTTGGAFGAVYILLGMFASER